MFSDHANRLSEHSLVSAIQFVTPSLSPTQPMMLAVPSFNWIRRGLIEPSVPIEAGDWVVRPLAADIFDLIASTLAIGLDYCMGAASSSQIPLHF